MKPTKRIRLGDLLVENGKITHEQLMSALAEQKSTGRKLGQALVDLNFVTENEINTLLAKQLHMPFIDLTHFSINPETVSLLSETHARRYRAIALTKRGDELLVGMADPTDIFAYDEIANLLNQPIKQAIINETALLQLIETAYRKTDQISDIAEELDDTLSDTDIDIDHLADDVEISDAPVIRLIQSLFEDAVQINASDIHIEPDDKVLRIRVRVDGVLQEQIVKEVRIAQSVTLKLKLMAGLNISEKRLPQDGRFNIRVKNKSIDIRLSTLPMTTGESVVMRLLDQSGGSLSLDMLGMREEIIERFKRLINLPNGLVLVTGPTGSGKTTTLYSALSALNNAEKKIITAEDPVEYRLPRINQVQIHTDIGLTFPTVLRTALRQDPDVILIGEMRDQETAEIGLRAAMTGHLVLSTLHTNDAISTANRLLDMGAEGFLVAASLKAVIAQRLIRKICQDCIEDDKLTPAQAHTAESILAPASMNFTLKRGRGCNKCQHTGYLGRIGIHELLEINEPLADALRSGDTVNFSNTAKRQANFKRLAVAAMDYVQEGVTTVEEVIRVAGSIEH